MAAKARTASTRTIGDVFVQLILTIVNPTAGSTDRVLDGPTNLVWIDPWRTYLESSGVQYVTERGDRGDSVRRAAGSAASSRAGKASATVWRGDHYVAALPLERIAPLVNGSLLAADPTLANLRALAPNVEWMNGVQFYLRRDMPIRARTRHPHRHRMGADEHFAAPVLAQHRARAVRRQRRAGILSVDVSDWTAPGSNGRPAMQCSREEVMRETWKQLKRSINVGEELLRDEDLHSWFLDPDIEKDPHPRRFLRRIPSRCW